MHLPIVSSRTQASTGPFSEYSIGDGLSHKPWVPTSTYLGCTRALGARIIPAHFILIRKKMIEFQALNSHGHTIGQGIQKLKA